MELRTIEVKGVEFDVFYDCTSERDPLGTGDSPTAYHVELIAIESICESIDITDYLANWVVEDITKQIIELEAN